MKKYLFLILFIIMPSIVFSQQALIKNTKLLFSASETIAYNSYGSPYVTVTNADTITSALETFGDGKNGDLRISVLVDTTSGTTKGYFELGLKVGDFGTDARNYKWFMIDSVDATNDGETLTYQMFPDFDFAKAPAEGYKIRYRQTGTQVNRVYINRIQYFPRR